MKNNSLQNTPRITLEDLALMVKKGFDSVDRRFSAMDKRFDAMDDRFDAMDKRFDRLESKFDNLEKIVVKDHASRLVRLERKTEII